MRKRTFITAAGFSIFLYCSPGNTNDLSEISFKPGEYTVRVEIIMPHLEESLRYATTNTRHCLGLEKASNLFPVLDHVSFTDCELLRTESGDESEVFDLVCLNTEAANGSARFVIHDEVFQATIEVKMGGKNMRFSQRIQGHRLGACR